mgnify:CR=1 FL=1
MKAKRRCMHGKRRRRSPLKNEIKKLTEEEMKPKSGIAPTTGGVGLIVDAAKEVFKGYGTTNPQIIKDARMMPGKM